jgi:2,5-dioxopentanoate dehydrogenase
MSQSNSNIFASPFAASQSVRARSFDVYEPAQRIPLLRRFAEKLHVRRHDILSVCQEETALTREELEPEFARMTGTLRMFAELLEEGSWVRAAIDTAPRDDAAKAACVGPPHDVRRMLLPIGQAAGVLGASNFPLAYGVCGGDTASALAAGLSVIVKEHPAHPNTGRLLAAIAHAAGTPLAYVTHEDPSNFHVVQELVDAVDAIGFTGSREGGLAIEKLACKRRIPTFCEMGSANLVILPEPAFRHWSPQLLAQHLGASILARVGQQCTKPGIILIDRKDSAENLAFVAELAREMDNAEPRRMLSPTVLKRYRARCEEVLGRGRQLITRRLHLRTKREHPTVTRDGHELAVPMLFELGATFRDVEPGEIERYDCESEYFWQDCTLLDEVFGPAALLVRSDISPNLDAPNYPPSLAASTFVSEWHHVAVRGRIVHNGVPTGVRVCHAMVHGGPFPATNVPHTTAVGPMAIERWCRPVCYQNCPDHLLPEELQDANPRGIMRIVDGVWTRTPARR